MKLRKDLCKNIKSNKNDNFLQLIIRKRFKQHFQQNYAQVVTLRIKVKLERQIIIIIKISPKYKIAMKLDGKYDKLKKFIGQLKQRKPLIEPFLVIEDIPKYGIFDFSYISKNPVTFLKVEKKIKDQKYEYLSEFGDDLKRIFSAVEDYLFEDDPLQQTCAFFKKQIDYFCNTFNTPTLRNQKPPQPKKFETSIKSEPSIVSVSNAFQNRKSTIPEKLEMLFLLRTNQKNQHYIRTIGEHYDIGKDDGDYYQIKLNNSNVKWLQFLKND